MGDWSHAQFQNQRLGIERTLAQGALAAALQNAEGRALDAGPAAYTGAEYDFAMAHWLLGRVLRFGGQAGAALPPLAEAQRRFQPLADGGNSSAAGMASAALTEQGDCLRDLGRLDEAAAAYEAAIALDEERGDMRDVAVGKGQLGTVRILQQRYAEALAAWDEARRIFSELGEPAAVATAWHQMGMVHSEAEQWEAAERAYRQALSIFVQHNLSSNQAASLGELGSLFDAVGRTEEAVVAYRQGADIRVALGDQAGEGRARNNSADTLVKLGRLDEARREIERAIECDRPFGHAAEPWKTFDILHNIESTQGNRAAAAAAWQQARDAYLAYRRQGGYAQTNHGEICDQVLGGIQQNNLAGVRQVIAELKTAGWTEVFVAGLEAIVNGVRNRSLADASGLGYTHSVELLLLLEQMEEGEEGEKG